LLGYARNNISYLDCMSSLHLEQKVDQLLEKGVADVIVKKELKKKLLSGKSLRVKLGIDPSGSDLHIGHMVVVRKLAEFQQLGHHILLLFGNFTGQIGDPTGKTSVRIMMTQKQVEVNAAKYLGQVKNVLDISKVETVWNADWLAPLTFADVVKLASQFTVSQMLERDMFQERMKNNLPISLHEFMYPLMQGYDSVALRADVEIGGTDQTFNLLAGRVLQKAYGQIPQDVLTVPILEGLDGRIKMGKSENNYIAVQDDPETMYGKTMSIPDDLILRYFELATDVSLDELDRIRSELNSGTNPRDIKMRLARQLVSLYHDAQVALDAEQTFVNVFQKGRLPEDMPVFKVRAGEWKLADLLHEVGLVSSKSEARRLIKGAAVYIDEKTVNDHEVMVEIGSRPKTFKVGKRRFAKITGK